MNETLKPIGKNIIFKFCANLTKSTFAPTSSTGIILSDGKDYEEHNIPQWAEIIYVADAVDETIKKAKYVLVEPNRWTFKVRWKNEHTTHGEYLWKTDESAILATSNELVSPY